MDEGDMPVTGDQSPTEIEDIDNDGSSCDIKFTYADTDTHSKEIAEIYSYLEVDTFKVYLQSFKEQMEIFGIDPVWKQLQLSVKTSAIALLREQLASPFKPDRTKAARCFLYIAQGCWSDVHSETEQQQQARVNCMLLYTHGIFDDFIKLLNGEISDSQGLYIDVPKDGVTYIHAQDVCTILSFLYTVIEIMREEKSSGRQDYEKLIDTFFNELETPMSDGLFAVKLLDMLNQVCNGSVHHYPVKKILLLLWKVILGTLGGTDELREQKAKYRKAAGLPPFDEDPMEVLRSMRASSPPTITVVPKERQYSKRKCNTLIKTAMKKGSASYLDTTLAPFYKDDEVKKLEMENSPHTTVAEPPITVLSPKLDLLPTLIPFHSDNSMEFTQTNPAAQDDSTSPTDPSLPKMVASSALPSMSATVKGFTTSKPPVLGLQTAHASRTSTSTSALLVPSSTLGLLPPMVPLPDIPSISDLFMEFNPTNPAAQDDSTSPTDPSLPKMVASPALPSMSATVEGFTSRKPPVLGLQTAHASRTSTSTSALLVPSSTLGLLPLPDIPSISDLFMEFNPTNPAAQGVETENSSHISVTSALTYTSPTFASPPAFKPLPDLPPISDILMECTPTMQAYQGLETKESPHSTQPSISEIPEDPELPVPASRAFPWKPKAKAKDISKFIERSKNRFMSSGLAGDQVTMDNLPLPIQESVCIQQQNLHVSLGEIQIQKEERLAHKPESEKFEITPTEVLYQGMLPKMPEYVAALTKCFVAASPTSKTRANAINIMVDVLPEELPKTDVDCTKLRYDISRNKEIINKCLSGIFLLLLKHFKLNHIFQYEYLSQHLIFANCPTLILRYFNQDMTKYVSLNHSIPILEFPLCVLEKRQMLTVDVMEMGDGSQVSWRNMFSSINFLRLMNKLVKDKQSRILMLVVFKSEPILKRTLIIRHTMAQLYILKLLKMQVKYFGRQWKLKNISTFNLIYAKVRHRLNDDWTYENDTGVEEWDFKKEECLLRSCINTFNVRRYGINTGSLM